MLLYTSSLYKNDFLKNLFYFFLSITSGEQYQHSLRSYQGSAFEQELTF
jgi:hypothetical protein